MNWRSRAAGPGILRLYLAAGVILTHVFHWANIATWAVYLFFVLSGFWISKLWDAKYSRCDRPYLVFLVSRFWRLLPLYWTCTALMLIGVWKICGRLHTWDAYMHSPGWWVSMLGIVGVARYPILLRPVWSLDMEMQFYLIAPVLLFLVAYCFSGRFAKAKLGALFTAGAIAFWWMPLMVTVIPYILFFLAGAAIAIGNWKPPRPLAIASGIAAVAMVIGVWFFPVNVGGIANGNFEKAVAVDGRNAPDVNAGGPLMITSTQQGDPGRWVAILFVAVCLPYVASALAQRSDKLDRTLGNLAYPVYLFHWVPVVMVGHINHFKNLTFQPVLEVLFAAIGSTLIYVVIDRPLDRRRRKFVESHVEAAREKATYLAIPAVENT